MTTVRLRTFVKVLHTTMMVEQECEDVQQIQDQSKKRSSVDGLRKGNDSTKAIKKNVVTKRETKTVLAG